MNWKAYLQTFVVVVVALAVINRVPAIKALVSPA